MFAQANSEHCRHKIFNADWRRRRRAARPRSLFDMIRHTRKSSPGGRAVRLPRQRGRDRGPHGARCFASGAGHEYGWRDEPIDILLKVETHNHPTAISPFPGAATAPGGEIRDEGATGRGAKPKAGLVGFTVSNLRIPGFVQPWETRPRPSGAHRVRARHHARRARSAPPRSTTSSAAPASLGYFRTFEQQRRRRSRLGRARLPQADHDRGRPRQRPAHARREAACPARAPLVAARRSRDADRPRRRRGVLAWQRGASEQLDFASVQRGNAEIQRRCAGGHRRLLGAGRGKPDPHRSTTSARAACRTRCPKSSRRAAGASSFRSVPSDEPGMSPLEIWCNEAQERYVLALAEGGLDGFMALCRRERCPSAVIGEASDDGRLVVTDPRAGERVVDMPIDDLLGQPPRVQRSGSAARRRAMDSTPRSARCAARRSCACCGCPRSPTRASSSRSATAAVGGMISRDPLVGPVAGARRRRRGDDVTAFAAGRGGDGDRRAARDRAARRARPRARIAVGEAVTNIAARRRRARSATSSCRRTGWPPAAIPAERRDLYRRGPRAGRIALPGARHRDPGRQGFAVHALQLVRATVLSAPSSRRSRSSSRPSRRSPTCAGR